MPPEQPVGSDGTLNWIYAGDSARFTNSVTIKSPVYTWHDLNLENRAAHLGRSRHRGVAQKLAVGGDPAAGGNLLMQQNADTVGEDPPLEAVHIHGLCASKVSSDDFHACKWGDGPSPDDHVWANVHDNTSRPTSSSSPN